MKISKSIVGIAVLGLMLCSFLSPVSAAATWPIAEGDELEYTEKEESKTESPGTNSKSSSQSTYKIVIVKVDANGTCVWKYLGKPASEQKDVTGDITVGGEEIVYDSDDWKIYSKALEDSSKAENVKAASDLKKLMYEFWGLKSVVVEYTVESTATTKKTTTTVTAKTALDEAVTINDESSEEWTEDGILVEKTSSSKQVAEYKDGTYTYTSESSFKQGGAGIPGYSVPVFLGILAFTTLGLIVAIRRRK
jgi:hypothetical protein